MRLYSFLVLMLFCGLAITQSTSDQQKTLITKRTATWCPNCGTWGWDFAKAIEELDNPNAILIRAHHSGDLQSQVAEDITENFNAVYQPEFYINEVAENVSSSSWPSKVNVVKEAIDANAEKPANVAFTIDGTHTINSISSSVSVEFLSTVEGEFYLATYLLEDNVVNSQASLGAGTVHNSVIRQAMSGESFGSQIVSDSATVNSVFSSSFELTSNTEEFADRNFRLLAVVWKKEGDAYLVENIHTYELGLSSNVASTSYNASSLKVIQNGGEVEFDFSLDKDYGNGLISLVGLDGRIIESVPFDARSGAHKISQNLNNLVPKIVLVSVTGNGKQLFSKKILLR